MLRGLQLLSDFHKGISTMVIVRPTVQDSIDKMWEPEARRLQKIASDLVSKLSEANKTIEHQAGLIRNLESHPLPPPSYRRPGTERMKFYHSGDLGDIIYACPVMMALGGGTLVLGPEIRLPDNVRDPMTPAKAESIGKLLRMQYYIDDVVFSATMPNDVDYDLNQMRNLFRTRVWHPRMSLCEVHLRAFGLSTEFENRQWLHVPPAEETRGAVVVARSERYRNESFQWRKVINTFGDKMRFVGSTAEHEDFQSRFGRIRKVETPSLLALASAIAGADMFIGNQSCPRAIAEGLKVPCVMEGFRRIPNCNFNRPGCINVYGSEDIIFPEVITRNKKGGIILSGIVDGFTGFGQLLTGWARGLKGRGWDVKISPTRTSEQFGTIPPDISSMLFTGGSSDVIFETHDELPKHDLSGKVVITMWEAPTVKPEVVAAINRSRALIVPSTWCATGFSASGVRVPIRIVHPGIDTSVFRVHEDVGMAGLTTFGFAGRYSHGPLRKGFRMVEEAFKLAFPDHNGVRLQMKVFQDCDFHPTDDRVILERRFLTDEELAKWYRSNTAFLGCSRSGGWELQPLQATAVGCCPIATKWSGPIDYLEIGRFVDYELEPASDPALEGCGVWAEPSVESIASHMMWVLDSPEEARSMGKLAAESASKFSMVASTKRLEAVLRNLEVL